jgi:hypothetical protein
MRVRIEGRREEDFSLLTFVDIPSFICAYLLMLSGAFCLLQPHSGDTLV